MRNAADEQADLLIAPVCEVCRHLVETIVET